jgi:hypothetical protein
MTSTEDRRDPAATRRARWLELARRSAKWIAAVLVVSLVLPAATKQWSDNQQQRQLKTEVTTRLAAAVAKATTDGGFLLGNRIQREASDAALRRAYQETLTAWKSEAGAIGVQLRGYFATARNPDADALVNAMSYYNRVVQAYIAYCQFYIRHQARVSKLGEFRDNLRLMRKQLGVVTKRSIVRKKGKFVIPRTVWRSKNAGVRWLPPKGFREEAQNVWAENIVNESAPLIRTIDRRQARGFQVGVRAFLRQIFYPFG